MEPIVPPDGQSPEQPKAVQSGQGSETVRPPQSVKLPGIPEGAWKPTSSTGLNESLKTPEINKPPVDPIEGMFSSFQSGNKAEFLQHMDAWSKQNPGMPVEFVAASLMVAGGGNSEKTAQLSQWTQEAKRLGALGGKEGVQVYDQLKEACKSGNQEAFDNIRRSGSPIAKKAVEMLGKDLLLSRETQPFSNLTNWDGPHKVREVLASLQKPPTQNT